MASSFWSELCPSRKLARLNLASLTLKSAVRLAGTSDGHLTSFSQNYHKPNKAMTTGIPTTSIQRRTISDVLRFSPPGIMAPSDCYL
jgi:hypothetical protein